MVFDFRFWRSFLHLEIMTSAISLHVVRFYLVYAISLRVTCSEILFMRDRLLSLASSNDKIALLVPTN